MAETAFLLLLSRVGFTAAADHGDTGYASSPTTMGRLFTARKPR